MQNTSLASYLTFEFISIYSPRALQTQKSTEIKLWMCPHSSMPVFSHSEYGGPTEHSQNGLPTVGFPTIHIRIPKDLVLSVESDEAKKVLIDCVYQQIFEQMSCLIIPSDPKGNLKTSMRMKQKQIDIITSILNAKEVRHDTRNIH